MGGMTASDSLGAQIRAAREWRHMTQQQLADHLEVDRKTVDNWENNRTSPRNRMGALRQWAPELGDGEVDPNVLKIRELGARLGLTPQALQAWIDTYHSNNRPQADAERTRAS